MNNRLASLLVRAVARAVLWITALIGAVMKTSRAIRSMVSRVKRGRSKGVHAFRDDENLRFSNHEIRKASGASLSVVAKGYHRLLERMRIITDGDIHD